MSLSPRTKALLATLRVANAPSVACHLIGAFVFGWTVSAGHDALSAFPALLFTVLGGWCLYFAGNLLNDWYDASWDRVNRPERSLPSGLFQPQSFAFAAAGLMILGIACLSRGLNLVTWLGLGLVACIGVYTRIHKATLWGILPMGLCRALLYPIGYLSGFASGGSSPAQVEWGAHAAPVLLALSIGLACYIAGLSLSARFESVAWPPRGARLSSLALLLAPLLTHFGVWWFTSSDRLPAWFYPLSMGPFLAWMIFTRLCRLRPTPRYVSALLAGIPWIDWIFFGPLMILMLRQHDPANPLFWTAVLAPPLAFLSAVGLQRVASAT